ncbi:HNH endonuclease [Fictibacillus nanhaiensis]|jgi:hypothetical protein|uniref:ABC-three component system protein n=1 Tax=Fictibacillus nanhaiensis TaxID=742169 RepID=UPI00203DE68C|nr:ABC-three component system protein [Fictibacillus nanhaiensis]MCM3732353.1 HNH endonuclease [Fictibacillus nanhaiensis]
MQINRKNLSANENIFLFSEVEGMCPLCTKTLMYEKNGKKMKIFEGAHIYPLHPTPTEKKLLMNEERLHEDVNNLDNIIALCRDCHKKFDNPRTADEYRKLVKMKKLLISRTHARAGYSDFQIELEIKHIILALVDETDDTNESPLSMNALKLNTKANKTLSKLTKRKIRNEITDYYFFIQKQFMQLDKQYPKSFDRIATQVKSFYLNISKTETSQENIYEQLTEWLSKKTENSSTVSCAIVISFFIQNCEVF